MTEADQTPHTSSRYEAELQHVRALLTEMGDIALQMLQQGLAVLNRGAASLPGDVTELERRINFLEVEIDDQCSRILATQQPTASDLRLLIGILKAATDLERVGDESKKIYRLGTRLRLLDSLRSGFPEQRHLGALVATIFRDALTAFRRGEAQVAMDIAQRDRLVDEEYERIQRQCVTFMMEDSRAIRRTLDLMWVIRALERIGDHAKNLCEHTVYIAAGVDVRHTALEKLQDGREAAKTAS